MAACEENRLTRAVDSGTTGPPELAIAELLRYLNRTRDDIVTAAGVAEEGAVDAHLAHALYALHASGFERPLIVVCGTVVSAWRATGAHGIAALAPIHLQDTPPFAHEYGELTTRLGFRAMRDEHLVEALARGGHEEAASVQQRLGDDLLTLLQRLKAETKADSLCLSGGLFFNTFFTSHVAKAAIFQNVYVPPHPGRNGAALGAAMACGGSGDLASPYLGPHYSDQEIKGTLENCKLSFDLLHEDRLLDLVLHQLSRGRLIGWYHGRLEWGPRALGHRSVLADPFAPHVLENLNAFLKRRPAFRTYGVSVPAARLRDIFEVGPDTYGASPFMQFEYRPRDPEKFRTILPPGGQTVRVHTVDDSEPRFLRLLEQWGARTGTPALVNTSFNGFHEPLVCSPRDAIRVFYGTGLDLLTLENFLLRK